MGTFGIEPDEVLHQNEIELLRTEKFVCMKVHELLLNRPVESFAVGIHLRRLRIRVIVSKMQFHYRWTDTDRCKAILKTLH